MGTLEPGHSEWMFDTCTGDSESQAPPRFRRAERGQITNCPDTREDTAGDLTLCRNGEGCWRSLRWLIGRMRGQWKDHDMHTMAVSVAQHIKKKRFIFLMCVYLCVFHICECP